MNFHEFSDLCVDDADLHAGRPPRIPFLVKGKIFMRLFPANFNAIAPHGMLICQNMSKQKNGRLGELSKRNAKLYKWLFMQSIFQNKEESIFSVPKNKGCVF